MTRLDWSKARLSNPDPARVVSLPEGGIPDGYVPVLRRMPLANYLEHFSAPASKVRDRIRIVERTGRSDANEFIHETALLILEHARRTSDASMAGNLLEAMPATFRRGLLIAWFGEFGPIGINPKTRRVRLRKPEERKHRPFNLHSAR